MSDTLSMDDMSKMLRHIMDTVAQGDQLEAIGQKVAAVTVEVQKANKRVDNFEGSFENMPSELGALRARVDAGANSEPMRPPPRRSTGSASSTSRSDHENRENKFPWLIHFGGWGPYGSERAKNWKSPRPASSSARSASA